MDFGLAIQSVYIQSADTLSKHTEMLAIVLIIVIFFFWIVF